MSPKKYLTDEDKRKANCEKSKRSYEKYVTQGLYVSAIYLLCSFRKKEEINRKRREKYRKSVRR